MPAGGGAHDCQTLLIACHLRLLLLFLLAFYGRYLYWREEYIHTQSYRTENEGVLSGALVQGYRCREHFCGKEGRKGQKHQSTAVSVSLDMTHVHAYSPPQSSHPAALACSP